MSENSACPTLALIVANCEPVSTVAGVFGFGGTFVGDGRGAAPVHYKLTVGFTELELMTKDKIYKGY